MEHWATNDGELTPGQRATLKGRAWDIETYHRGLKQCCGVERCQARKAESQRSHVGMAIRALVRLAAHHLRPGAS